MVSHEEVALTRYASSTSVSSAKSRMEIEETLARYGADSFIYGSEPTRAAVGFTMKGRQVRFVLPMPDKDAREFTHTPAKRQKRSPSQALAAWEQATRQRWRALALVVKAKLEAVESGITEFEDEFMAHIVLPDGKTVGERMKPQIAEAYETGNMPPLLGYGG